MQGTMTTTFALDRPIRDSGGLKHIQRALQGEQVTPANYTFSSHDRTSIIYRICGLGPTLLVATCPGWGGGLDYIPAGYDPLTQSGEITLVVIQTRGTLPSERPADERRMGSKHMAADIDALRTHLGRYSINVQGHSNGGAIALGYAELFPRHCQRLIHQPLFPHSS
jgi:pimeloyl-ACP methyl ester carboxylesterase